MIAPNPDDLPPITQREALRIMQAATRRPQAHYDLTNVFRYDIMIA